MLNQPHITQSVEQQTAVIHLTVPRAEMRHVMQPGLRELMATLAAQGIAPAGPWFSHHLRLDPDTFDFEISVPVASTAAPAGRVRPSRLPSVRIARTVYRGPYEGLGQAWDEFFDWIKTNGHAPAGNIWECYLAGPESNADPADWRTEFNCPLIDE
jgi:effector-binding domain-containing protein